METVSPRSAIGRAGPPVLRLLLILLVTGIAYRESWRIPSHAAHLPVATASIFVYFGALAFGALPVWIACARRGSSRSERVAACAVVPFLWMTKEVIRVATLWPLPDALFFYLNPAHVTLALAVISEMGFAELWLRRSRRRAGEGLRVLAPAPLAAAVLPFLYILVFQAPPERAAASFFAFLKLYTRIVHGTSLEY